MNYRHYYYDCNYKTCEALIAGNTRRNNVAKLITIKKKPKYVKKISQKY